MYHIRNMLVKKKSRFNAKFLSFPQKFPAEKIPLFFPGRAIPKRLFCPFPQNIFKKSKKSPIFCANK